MSTGIHETNISRRSLIKLLGWGSFLGTLGISLAGAVRFFYPRVLFEKPSTFRIGSVDDFTLYGTLDYHIYESWKEEYAVWIVREKKRIYALHARCTHLGCSPNWLADEAIFQCPCHGSQFRHNGENFAGPASRPLDRFHISAGDDGRIVIDRSRVYTFKEFHKVGAYVEV
jgi:cytochrome b6-f complex iron-sulfur subunit